MIVTFVGFGELAAAWVDALRDRGDLEVRVFARTPRDAPPGIDLHGDLARALEGAAVVLACVPAGAAVAVAEACLDALEAGTLYVDLAPADPDKKRMLAGRMGERDVDYTDVALLGTVVISGLRLPMLAAGPGAERWAQIGSGLGMRITPIHGDAGSATAIKLIRSVYMKGRDALVLEMLVAARRHGVERDVIRSIGGAGEQVPFEALADRVMGALSVHAGRRADELAASARQLQADGVEPLVTRAAAQRLRWMADLGVHERVGERHDDAVSVLDAIDELTATRGSQTGASGLDD
jgi:3-hydroxyisobutyrate dehydrogenase-like beta-hydroxyacid dehydrogenase